MPSKALLACSNRLHAIHTAAELGIEGARGKPSLSRMLARKKKLIAGFARYRERQIFRGNFKFIRGRPHFIDRNTVQLASGKKISSRYFIICTGSRIAQHSFEGLGSVRAIDSDAALNARRLPKSMAVLGGGPVALELGQYFSRLGTRVTILQRSRQVLSSSDTDLARCLQDSFEEEGIQVMTGVELQHLAKTGGRKI